MCNFQWSRFQACRHIVETRVACYYYTHSTINDEPTTRRTIPSTPPSSPSSSTSSSSSSLSSTSSSSSSSTATVHAEPKQKSAFLSPPYTCETWARRPRPLLEVTRPRGPEPREGTCPGCTSALEREEAEIERKERGLEARNTKLEAWREDRRTIINQGRRGLGRLAERMRRLGVLPDVDDDGDDEDEGEDEDEDEDEERDEEKDEDDGDLTDEEVTLLDLYPVAYPR